jgi:FtsH-binding integral membrane protein
MFPERSQPAVSRAGAGIDTGLQRHMQSIYNRMTLGVLVTAVVSWLVASSPALIQFFLGGPQAYIVMFAPVLVVWFGFNPMTMSESKLRLSFFAISALYGISFSVIFMAYTHESIAKAFFIATGMFAGLSIFGYVTKRDLTALGSFAVMGIWGVFLMGLVNLFLHNEGLADMLSVMGIVAFSGLTAWQTQAMKEMYHPAHGAEGNSRMAWSAALTLYISFIALFMHILRFVGNNR